MTRRRALFVLLLLIATIIVILHWRRISSLRETWERHLANADRADQPTIASIDSLSDVVNVNVAHSYVGATTETEVGLAEDESWRDAARQLDLYALAKPYRVEFWFGGRTVWKDTKGENRAELARRRLPEVITEPALEATPTAPPSPSVASEVAAARYVVDQVAELWTDAESIVNCLAAKTLQALSEETDSAKLREGAAKALAENSGQGDPCTRTLGTLASGTEIELTDSQGSASPSGELDDDRRQVRVLSGMHHGKVGYFQMSNTRPTAP